MKVKITKIGKLDAFYGNRKELIGAVGFITLQGVRPGKWNMVRFVPVKSSDLKLFPPVIHFAAVKYEVIAKGK